MNIYELKPKYNRAKSFYEKAHVIIYDNGIKVLRSYETDVIRKNADGTFSRLWNDWSATTARHVNEFIMQEGRACGISKAEWQKMEVATDEQ